MNLLRQPSTATHAACAVAALLCLAAFWFLVRNPLIAQRIDHERRFSQLQLMVAHSQQDKIELDALRQEVNELTERAQSVRQRMPEQPKEADLLRVMATIAGEEGLSIVEYRRGAVTRNGEFSQLNVGVTGNGSYESICRFVHRLHHLPRITTLEQLDIRTANQSKQYPIDMTIALYFEHKSEVQKTKDT